MQTLAIEPRRAAGDQVGQEFVDRIARGRAAWNEIVHQNHLVDRMDAVQQKRQLGVVGNGLSRLGAFVVDLPQDVAEIEATLKSHRYVRGRYVDVHLGAIHREHWLASERVRNLLARCR